MRPKELEFRVALNVIPATATNALTTNNTYYDGISGGSTKSNMSINAVPSSFKRGDLLQAGLQNLVSNYMMYSFNNTTSTQRTRTATITYRFTDENLSTRDIALNIPTMVPVRIGLNSSVFSTPLLPGCQLLSATPTAGTLRDYYQEVTIL